MNFYRRYVEDQQFLGELWMRLAWFNKFGEEMYDR